MGTLLRYASLQVVVIVLRHAISKNYLSVWPRKEGRGFRRRQSCRNLASLVWLFGFQVLFPPKQRKRDLEAHLALGCFVLRVWSVALLSVGLLQQEECYSIVNP